MDGGREISGQGLAVLDWIEFQLWVWQEPTRPLPSRRAMVREQRRWLFAVRDL